ncbi:hypothetical protein [Aquimarina sediminis]|uniref:hypothetical protein n=1 Tax=Aquimarina sediminis TaxID=2070536 RepID=UPI000CA02F8A|nr:hypothetical protein [Aquimarina sediminis]
MKKILYIYMFSFATILSAQELNIKIKFHPSISVNESKNIDIEVNFVVKDEIVAQRNVTRYPTSVIQTLDNPNNDDVYIKLKVVSPDGWTVIRNPIKYNRNDRKITLRRVNDAYFALKNEANEHFTTGAYTDAVSYYNYILDNEIFSSENQKFEILRSKANALEKKGAYNEAIQTYIAIREEVDLSEIGGSRKQVYVNELFNSILKAGNYTKLQSPALDFPESIQSEGIVNPTNWQNFSEVFDQIYPNTIQLSPTGEHVTKVQDIQNQFMIIGNTLGTF